VRYSITQAAGCTFEVFQTVELRHKTVSGQCWWTAIPYSDLLSPTNQGIVNQSKKKKRTKNVMPNRLTNGQFASSFGGFSSLRGEDVE
jgi:hypothetical protein